MSDYQGNIIIKNPATPTGPSAYGSAPGMWSLNEVAYWIKQGVWPNPAIVPDLNFPYVSLLLSTTSLGNANNNLFVDSSGAFNPLGRAGNTTQGSFTPYSTNWSNFFDGSGDYFTVPYTTANFDWWTSGVDFTIEAWVFATNLSTWQYTDSAAGVNSVMVGNAAATSEVNYWSFGPLANGTVRFKYYNGANNFVTSTATITANTWNHVAMTKTSSGITVYVNGVAGTTTAISGTPQSSTGYPLILGQINNATASGYISNLRVVRGTAIYSGNFTPPTAPLTAVTNTTLLTCQSNRFRDVSTNNLTLTVTGNTSVQDFGPFSPAYPGASYNQSDITNWSGYFDGSGDYLTTTNTNFTGNATVECWLYVNSLANPFQLFGTNNGVSDLRWIGALVSTSGALSGAATAGSGGFYQSANGVITIGQWHHIAWVKNGSNIFVYVNGTQVATCTASAGYAYNATPLYIGRLDGNDAYCPNGYISNLRIVNGTAVYTSTFTPPTAPLTAISGTCLLTLQNAAFTDNSTNNFVITPFGNATVTGNSPFNTVGYWSNYFDGSSYLAAANNAAIQLGTGAFTVEGWFNIPSYAANQPIFDQRASGGSASAFVIYVKTTGTLAFYSYSPGIDVTFNTVISTNAWNHFAFVRSGNTGTMYVNGVAQSTTIDLSAYNNTSSANRIMQSFDPSYATGYLSNFRIVKGTAVYTANFTPPTAPLTAISGTGLLTCQSGRFIDNSGNNLTITPNGSPQAQSFDPFYTATVASNGGSLYLDGSGDYLTSPTSPAYDFRSSNFTIEGWFYFTNGSANSLQTLFSNYTSFSSAGSIFWGKHTNNSGYVTVWFSSYSTGGPLLAETTYPPTNAWTHYAVVRNGNTFTLYRNGVATATASWSGAATAGSCPIWVGTNGDGTQYPFPGYISDFRISKSAVYTAAFTPPTAPLTPSANTTLLINGMNAGIYDATTINDLETVGNAQVRYPSPFAPADYWAGAFDGTSDWLATPSNAAFGFGTGDFTIECWAYPTSTKSNMRLWQFSDDSDNVDISSGGSTGAISYYNGSTSTVSSSGVITFNAWSHIACVRSSGTVRIYVNGVLQVTQATTPNSSTRILYIAGQPNNWFQGSISNFRIVKGTAVYTSNFTPPTSPLTAISGTSLLTCQNKTFIDNSSNAFTITAFGNATAGAIGPFTATGGTSMYFDGTGDYLSIPASPNLTFGTGDFTMELWVYSGANGTSTRTMGNGAGASWSANKWVFATGDATYVNKFIFGCNNANSGAALLYSTTTFNDNTWKYVAITRSGNTWRLFVNGVLEGTATSSASLDGSIPATITVGRSGISSDADWAGYIDDLRLTKGVARYTSNFTPPTQPFPIY